MGPVIVLEHYRIGAATGAAPVEIGRNGPAITYKGSDLKSGAPVAITKVPIDSVDPAERGNFEEKARTAMLLDHANIAKTVAFGTTDESFIFISEYPQGESVEAWVKANGPMPADAVLRIALQVVSALSAASFHGITHPAIHPANLLIVSGKTAEGGWPYVKLTHFGLAGLKSAPGHTEPDLSASDYASPEQLLQGTIDFRSEIYSLGATLCFLLTGVFYSAYPRSPQTRRFARPLRTLISKTLEDDPSERPQDPVLFTEELRACLVAVERRQELKQKFGIPLPPVVAKPPGVRRFRIRRPRSLLAPVGSPPAPSTEPVVRRRGLRPAWAVIGLLLLAGVAAALFLPEDVVTAMIHRKKPVETIGIPVGVPDASPATLTQNNPPVPPTAVVPNKPVALPAQQSASPAVAAVGSTDSRAVTNQSAEAPSPEGPAQASSPEPALVAHESAPAVQESAMATNSVPVPEAPQTRAVTQSEGPPSISSTGSTHTSDTSAPGANQKQVAAATPPAASPVAVAENTKVQEAAPPAEAPEEKTSAVAPEQSVTGREENTTAHQPADQGEPEEHVAPTKPKVTNDSDASRSRNRKSLTQSKVRTPLNARVPRALPVGPGDEPALHKGEIKARVLGVTPAGNVILALPNGERAIVAPEDADQYSQPKRAHRRPHRVIIERRMVYPPEYQAPYQPFAPSD